MKSVIFVILSVYFSFFSACSFAAPTSTPDPEPLTSTMDKNMLVMTSTYIQALGSELQMRATDLYAIGEALLSHSNSHPQCQKQGEEAIQEAKELYLIGQQMSGGKEVNPKMMQAFVYKWVPYASQNNGQ